MRKPNGSDILVVATGLTLRHGEVANRSNKYENKGNMARCVG